jgi:PKD repeat protein
MALLNFPNTITVVLGSYFNAAPYYGLAEDDVLTLTKGTGSVPHTQQEIAKDFFPGYSIIPGFPYEFAFENVDFWSEDGTFTPSPTNRLVFIPYSKVKEQYLTYYGILCGGVHDISIFYNRPMRARIQGANAAGTDWGKLVLARNKVYQSENDYNFKDIFDEVLATDATAGYDIQLSIYAVASWSYSAIYALSFSNSITHAYAPLPLSNSLTVTREVGGSVPYNPNIFKYMDEAVTVSANFSATPLSGISPLTVQFQDLSTGGATSWLWSFGDGDTSTEQNPIHTYYGSDLYDVSLIINSGSDTETKVDYINVYASSSCHVESDYITICGPESELLARFGECKSINLKEFIPLYLRESETEDLVVLFEDFLNEMFQGSCGWVTSANELVITQNWSVLNSASNSGVSGDVQLSSTYDLSGSSFSTDSSNVEQIEIYYPTQSNLVLSARRISVLEKISRLTELHDPDLIDLDFIQFFAANLGYNVEVARNEFGGEGDIGSEEFGGVCGNEDINKYLRFVVQNLPTWYKIKSTNNAIKIMLYSFGLIAELKQCFTNNYLQSNEKDEYNQPGNWVIDKEGDLSKIKNDWIPTSHFIINVDFDASSDISFDRTRRLKSLRAIESIRPINTVFRKLEAFVNRQFDINFGVYMRATRYTVIESNGNSNGWA